MLFLFFSLLMLASAAPFYGDVKHNVINRQAGGNGADCKQMIVVFARGTTEPAPIGIIAGPPLKSALQSTLGAGNVDFQGVDYPADIAGFLAGGDAGGSKAMAQLVTQAVADCPDSDVIMAGYRYAQCPPTAELILTVRIAKEASSCTTPLNSWMPIPLQRSPPPSSSVIPITRSRLLRLEIRRSFVRMGT